MSYRVVFSPEAQEQLTDIFRFIAERSSRDVAARYTEGIVSHCESLCLFPRFAAGCETMSGRACA
ncbi:type II toxin-antitoxin system RelE/ParE family toxin [Acidithiobacillus sp.]|uniref:type II toxin-antitoxin system RelE/ParE family toxin n=1 Tax=Acidithiobacillus sp. TaxID=1872118 RepID=UPI0032AF1D5D